MPTPNRFPLRRRLLLCSLAASLSLGGPPLLDLQSAMDLALENNRDLLNAREAIDDARLLLNAREADFDIRPGLRLRAGQRDETPQTEAALELRRRFHPGGEVQLLGGSTRIDDDTQTFLRLNLRQPLFRRAGALPTREPVVQARRTEIDARRAYHERQQDLVLQVATAYEAILRAARQVESDQRTLERLDTLTLLTQAREDTGQITRVDTLRIQQQRGEAAVRLDNSRDVLETVREEFMVLLGLDPHQAFDVKPPPIPELDPPHPDEAFAMALNNRLDLARAFDLLDDAARGIRLARRDLLPDVQLLGDLTYRDTSENRESWFVGVSIEPDFSSAERQAQVGRAENRAAVAERQLVDLHYAIQIDVRRQIRNYQRAQTNLRVAARNRHLAEQRIELAEALFRMGRGDAFSLSDAEDIHARAVSEELAARSEAALAAYRLLRALGTLLEAPEDLKTSP